MYVAWASDIHLNFVTPERLREFGQEVIGSGVEALILSGDLSEGNVLETHLTELKRIIGEIKIYFVMGNHDLYRSSMFEMTALMGTIQDRLPGVMWLTQAPMIHLEGNVGLIGADGWYCGELGDYWHTSIYMNDFDEIEELQDKDRMTRLTRIQYWARYYTNLIHDKLTQALDVEKYQEVILVTHVPPYHEASLYKGKPSDKNWAPFMVNTYLGQELDTIMAAHPDQQLTVLCGHTHHRAVYQRSPNIEVRVAHAQYYQPKLEDIIEVV